ncbi:hypothetical protein ACFQBQ_07755 [Granulicella cerasi]|uniref:Uncharacterized protein n=1 Tax=Granulicella cerasi TaxID=741063 RepID=A0ABW1Z7V9_9BACT|nr:hypothetical protein [Granulicella cerasi]
MSDRLFNNSTPTKIRLQNWGYIFVKNTTCRSCEQQVEVWKTKNGKDVLYDPASTSREAMTCHFVSCPVRSGRRAAKADIEERSSDRPANMADAMQQSVTDDIQRMLQQIHARHHAQAVVIVYPDGAWQAVWTETAHAEDVRTNMITAANGVRVHMQGARR